MRELDDYKEEILEKIVVEYPELRNSRMNEIRQIFGGADTTIYGFDLVSDSKSIPLILRIYRPAFSDSARREFRVLQSLHVEGIRVPRPYLCNEKSDATGRAYIIMERVEGPLLSDELSSSKSTPRFNQLLESFVGNLVEIHSLDWTKTFTFLDWYDITENPHLFFTYELARPKEIIANHRVDALSPVIDWIEADSVELREPSLLHADYHAMNNLVRDENELVTIDWGNTKLGDFRHDLAFAVIALNSMGFDLKDKLVSLYESISGKKVENLEYFMVLSGLWNLLRIYSCVFDHRITGENEETTNLFTNEYRDYALYTIRTTQQTTGVSMSELLDTLKEKE
ncbi:MAG: phosphotransferase [Candidatus Thorarchaeota archaeon]|jgi:aminoglycoside phosphotransferase (APT) family kinase protein